MLLCCYSYMISNIELVHITGVLYMLCSAVKEIASEVERIEKSKAAANKSFSGTSQVLHKRSSTDNRLTVTDISTDN